MRNAIWRLLESVPLQKQEPDVVLRLLDGVAVMLAVLKSQAQGLQLQFFKGHSFPPVECSRHAASPCECLRLGRGRGAP